MCRVFKKRNYEERSTCTSLSYDVVHEASSTVSILSDTFEQPNDNVTAFTSNQGSGTSTNNDTWVIVGINKSIQAFLPNGCSSGSKQRT